MRSISSFLALGDSFTEGLDDWRADGTPRGWADRVAEQLARLRNIASNAAYIAALRHLRRELGWKQ